MSSFDLALPVILRHEGGFVNHPNDPGGATNYGVSLRWLKSLGDLDGDGWLDGDLDHDGDVDIDDIKLLTPDMAGHFYRTHWWDKNKYFLVYDQTLATKILDFSVVMGDKQSHKLLQRSLRAFDKRLVDDGVLGPKSFEAINSTNPQCLVASYECMAEGFFRQIALKPNLTGFLGGWLNRVYD